MSGRDINGESRRFTYDPAGHLLAEAGNRGRSELIWCMETVAPIQTLRSRYSSLYRATHSIRVVWMGGCTIVTTDWGACVDEMLMER